MPMISSDPARQAALTERQKVERAKAAKEQEEADARTDAALQQLAQSMANKFGVEARELIIIMCRRGRRATFRSS